MCMIFLFKKKVTHGQQVDSTDRTIRLYSLNYLTLISIFTFSTAYSS